MFANHFVLQWFNESPDFGGTLKSAVVKQMSSVKMIFLKKLYIYICKTWECVYDNIFMQPASHAFYYAI